MAISYKFLLLFLLIGLFVLEYSEARGGRGGGGRGGSRGGGSRGSRSRGSRSRSSSVSRKRTGFLSTKTAITTAVVAGTVYGASSWRRRRAYRSNRDAVPTVCYNDKYVSNQYGNISYLGRFICPMDGQEEDLTYCCGDEGKQTCCGFFDDGGRVAGVVIGVIIFAIIIGVLIFYCCLKRQNKSPGQVIRSWRSGKKKAPHEQTMPLQPHTQMGYSGGSASYQPPPPAGTASYHPSPPQTAVTYPVQPQVGATVAPPSYEASTDGPLPYGLKPEGSDMGKPPLPSGDISSSPYPPADPNAAPYPPADPNAAPYPPPGGMGYPPGGAPMEMGSTGYGQGAPMYPVQPVQMDASATGYPNPAAPYPTPYPAQQ